VGLRQPNAIERLSAPVSPLVAIGRYVALQPGTPRASIDGRPAWAEQFMQQIPGRAKP